MCVEDLKVSYSSWHGGLNDCNGCQVGLHSDFTAVLCIVVEEALVLVVWSYYLWTFLHLHKHHQLLRSARRVILRLQDMMAETLQEVKAAPQQQDGGRDSRENSILCGFFLSFSLFKKMICGLMAYRRESVLC